MAGIQIGRRGALGLMAGASAAVSWPGVAFGQRKDRPWLATPAQIEAETMFLALIDDPAVKAVQAKLKADLSATPRDRMPDAAATLDNAIAQWTASLMFGELAKRPTRPVLLWSTDDTSRTWLGHTLPGVGTSGDNPDAVYRMGSIMGGGRYEILGRFHPESRPTQFLLEVNQGDMTRPADVMPVSGGSHADIHNAAMISDKELVVAPDGSFRITLGGKARGPNHLNIPGSGPCVIGGRDILADWRQRAARLEIRRLDPVKPEPFTLDMLRGHVVRDLEGYVRFWSNFPNIWFGGLKPNTHSPPQARPGGWGFVSGMNFHLAPDEALVVTRAPGAAKYMGFQIIDPWMIAPDARTRQVCLNNTQSIPNSDGTYTYVIAATDPGVANWLDTTGWRDGYGIMRWQQVPAEMTNEGLIRDFRVVKTSEIAAMNLPRVTPAQRRAAIAARGPAYNTRVR